MLFWRNSTLCALCGLINHYSNFLRIFFSLSLSALILSFAENLVEIVHVLKLKQTISFSPCLYRKPSNVVSFFHCHSKELLFLGFLFPAAPILFFFCWNTIPMGLWDHELQKGWWYVLFLALCNMPRQSINIHWINLCHHHSSNCPHVGNQWMTSCKCQNDLLKKSL